MKNVLLVITGAFYLGGGIAVVNRLVIRALAEGGCTLDILSLLEIDNQIDRAYISATQVNYRVFAGNKVAFSLAVWKALFTRSYDLVFSDHVNLASILVPLSWLNRQRYIVWLHGEEVFQPKPDFEGKLGLRAAHHYLSSSEFTRSRVVERYPHTQIIACDLALDPGSYPVELPEKPESYSGTINLKAVDGICHALGERVILFVGRMDPNGRYKGQEKLLLAFPAISEQFPDAQLVLAGDGEDYRYYNDKAKTLPARTHPSLFLPGYLSTELLAELYRHCFMFAMPSHGEGFGLVYLEAMLHAKPCLGSRYDAASCVINDGVTGSLVDEPVNPDQVAICCLKLLRDPDRAVQMGLAGYDLVRSRYLFPNFKERFLKALVL